MYLTQNPFLFACLFVVLRGVQEDFCLVVFLGERQEKPAWVNLQHSCLNDIDVQRDAHIPSSIIIVISFTETPSITGSSAFKGTGEI